MISYEPKSPPRYLSATEIRKRPFSFPLAPVLSQPTGPTYSVFWFTVSWSQAKMARRPGGILSPV